VKYRWIRVALGLSALALFLGCPKRFELAPWHVNPCEHPDYPCSRYITGTGGSEDGRSDAGVQAQSEVAKKIRSSLVSVVDREIEVIQDGERKRATKLIRETILVKSEFKHNELVLIIDDAAQTDERAGKDYAFAALKRAKADRLLAERQKRVTQQLDEWRHVALNAYEGAELRAFVRAARDFAGSYDAWDVIRCQRRAVTGGAGPDPGEVDGWGHELRRAGMDLHSRTVWNVRAVPESDAVSRELVTAVESLMRDSVAAQGFDAVIADEPCGNPGTADIVFDLETRIYASRGLGRLGYKAEVELESQASRCGSDDVVFQLDPLGTAIVGVHPSDKRRALRIVIDKVRKAEFVGQFAEHLREFDTRPLE